MRKFYLLTTLFLVFVCGWQANAQYCTPVYSTGCTSGDTINDFIMADAGINHLGSGCSTGGYGDFTGDPSLHGAVDAGETYDFSATHGFGGQYLKIWIDFDANGSFEDPGELLFTSASGSNNTVGSISIPSDVGSVVTRMRVMGRWNGAPTDSCTPGGSWGETHDYTVEVTGGGGGGDCEWEVHVWGAGWGDFVTWQLSDAGGVILSGGPYGNGYDDTQTITAGNGPMTFYIVSALGDNTPNYTVTAGGNVVASGTLAGNTDATHSDLMCDSGGGGNCEWEVHVWGAGWGDFVTWQLSDAGGVILSGGPYGNGYDDTQTITAGNGPMTFYIVSALGDNTPNYTVTAGGNVVASGTLAGNTDATHSDLMCDSGGGGNCEWEVHVWSAGWGDFVTWQLSDAGGVILSGGPYGNGYDDTQTITAGNGPMTFYIVSALGDNTPNYTVTAGGNVVASGTLAGNTDATHSDLMCDSGGGGTDCETTPGIVINDDGTIENGMSGNPAVVTEMIFADKFTPSGYPATIESVCSAFITVAGGTPDLPYDIVVYDDDGAGGAPGTLIGEMTGLTANGIPVFSSGASPVWQSEITSSENWEITDGSVYIGVRFAPTTPNHYIASDESTTTPLVGGYWWNDNAGVWQAIQAAFPNYRALFIRPVLEVGASDPCAVTVFPFTETFENDSESRDCWTQQQVVGAGNWTYATGSSGGSITTANSGTLNARFVSQNGVNSPITKLISPVMDLTSLNSPEVTFYYGQEDWAGDQNELKVYYRISESDPWVEIAHYTANVNSWTEEVLALPNPSATYQIAFEGINNWGRANVVDDVTVDSGADPCAVTVFPFTETFENDSASRDCWTQQQVVGAGNWTYATGSSGGSITTANSGTLNARFVSQNGVNSPITKLISPVIDLTSLSSPEVTFYYGQEDWAGDQNELKVYYRISESDPWVEIAHYTANVNSWTEEVLALPNPSATYQIAFEGINNWGRANVVDDVTVDSGGGGGTDCETTPGIVINDDGTIENGMSGNPAVVTEMIFADKFTPSGYPATIESVCSAFITVAGGTPDLPYDIVVYDDDGAGGAPGTLIGEMTGLTANGIPLFSPGASPVWQSEITSSENWEITDGSVYIGVRFAPTTPNHYIASDESATTPLVGGYWWNDNAGVWQAIQAAFPNYRALFIRPVLEVGASGDCGTEFTDSGGSGGNYSNNENTTWTFNPGDPGNEVIVATFTAFSVESGWDALYVYDGPDASAPLIDSGNPATPSGFPAGGWYGTSLIGPFTSTHPSGALTFVFRSDSSVTMPGWIADITCEAIGGPINNDDCDDAIALSCGDIVTGTTVGMNNSGGNAAPDVFYSYTGSGVQEQVTVSLCGSLYDTYLRVYSDCTLTNQIAFNDDFCGLQSQLSFISDGVSTYIIMVEGFSSNAGDYTLEITCVPDDPVLNDDCEDAIPLNCGDTHSGSTTFATNSGGNAAPDVFYSYTGSGETEFVTVSLCGSSYDTYLRIYSDCTLTNQIAFNDDSCGLQSQLTFESDGTSTYIIMVEGFSSNSGDYVIELTCAGLPGCGDVFTDSGGPGGNYSNNEDTVWTFTPDVSGDVVTVIFNEFNIEPGWDALYVFDGPTTSDPMFDSGNPATGTGFPAGGWYGTDLIGPFTSTHPSGALTFRFLSDGSVTRPGWVADIVCAPYSEPNDDCEDAIALACGDVVTGDTSFATDSGMNPSADVFYTFTGSGTPQIVTLSLCGSSYDTYLRVFEDCDLDNEIAFNDDFCGLQSQLSFMSDGTSTYVIMVEGFGSQFGEFTLEVSCVDSPGCGDTFTDTGGSSGNYGANEDIVWTFTPNAGEVVTLTFSSFDVEAEWDALYVYDGPNTSSPLIDSGNPATGSGFPAGGYWGNTIPGPFTSTDPSGALTVRFMSDGSIQNAGWIAEIGCGVIGIDNTTIDGFVFYPNPMNQVLNISADTTIETVTLYNVLGQVVLFQNVNATSVQLNVSELASGAYMMKVTSEGSIETHQVIRR